MATTEPAPTLTTELIDPTAAQVDFGADLGNIVVMRFWDEDRARWGVRILTELPPGTEVMVGEA